MILAPGVAAALALLRVLLAVRVGVLAQVVAEADVKNPKGVSSKGG